MAMTSQAVLEDSECWKVSGITTAEAFFRAASLLLPDATHMFLEGSPSIATRRRCCSGSMPSRIHFWYRSRSHGSVWSGCGSPARRTAAVGGLEGRPRRPDVVCGASRKFCALVRLALQGAAGSVSPFADSEQL